MNGDIKFNDDDPPAIRAALRVARQAYVRSEKPSLQEMKGMLQEASELWPESETKVPNDVLALIVCGMLRFAGIVEEHQGVDSIKRIVSLIAKDLRDNTDVKAKVDPALLAALQSLIADWADA